MDDEDALRAEALTANELLVIGYARARGISFEMALGKLLRRRTLSKSSISVRALNFTNADIRGSDLKRSLLCLGKYSKNEFNFKTSLRAMVGAKDDYALEKKINEFQFNNPMLVIAAIGTQFTRLEMRYLLNGIDFREAYGRKIDQQKTMLAITHDLYEYGIHNNIMSYIFQFTSQIIDPSFDLTTIEDGNVTQFSRSDKNDKKSDSNANDAIGDVSTTSNFTFDDNEINYNINDELGCTIKLSYPMFNLYNNFRQHFGNSAKKDTIYAKYSRGEQIKFCSNGACWLFNLGCDACPFCNACTGPDSKLIAHLLTHYCALCEGPHPIIVCVFIRSFMAIVKSNDNSWFKKSYNTTAKQLFSVTKFNKNKYKNFGSRSNNSNSGGSNFSQRSTNAYQQGTTTLTPPTSSYYNNDYNNNNYGYDHGYSHNNHNNNNNNNGGHHHRGGKGNRRNNDNKNNRGNNNQGGYNNSNGNYNGNYSHS